MKKVFIILLILLPVAAAALIFLELKTPTVEPSPVEEPKKYDEVLLAEYLAAEEKGDLIAMNAAYDKNMEKTGVSFLEHGYDPSHGGKIYTYGFSVDDNGGDEIITGTMYVVLPEVDLKVQSSGENSYFAVDRRTSADPEIVVYDSWRADSDALIRKLCGILLEHEAAHPSQWNRTLDSMAEEWEMHNAAYQIDYKTDRAKDVNLNNADENTDWLARAAKELAK